MIFGGGSITSQKCEISTYHNSTIMQIGVFILHRVQQKSVLSLNCRAQLPSRSSVIHRDWVRLGAFLWSTADPKALPETSSTASCVGRVAIHHTNELSPEFAVEILAGICRLDKNLKIHPCVVFGPCWVHLQAFVIRWISSALRRSWFDHNILSVLRRKSICQTSRRKKSLWNRTECGNGGTFLGTESAIAVSRISCCYRWTLSLWLT